MRLGPRPLALYLGLAAMSGAGQQPFLTGVRAYWGHPYRRYRRPHAILWQDGASRLVDHGGDGWPVLMLPSLINRAEILDLLPERSLVQHLGSQGFRPLMLDWGEPVGGELGLTLADHIHGRAAAALDAVLAATGRAPVLLGYCLGGLLACGLAQRHRRDLAGLALLATPWDFHADRDGAAVPASGLVPLAATIGSLGYAPVDLLQAFFASLDPMGVVRKYERFGELAAADPRARRFVAVEDWLNDGVPLAGPVAQECLWDWYGANLPGRGRWAPGGVPVLPELLELPAFIAVPRHDRIVPAASAEALVRLLPQATLARPAAGHVSMVVGESAPTQLWRPLTEWLRRIAPGGGQSRVRAASAIA
jgi:polyhydroxyalkanoate synthase